jgi:hypothetical protein
MNTVSPRQQVARNLSDTCVFGGLTDSYGVNVTKTKDGKGKEYWSVSFCKARVLDGEIRVYSPNFILVSWQTAYRDMAAKGNEVFRSELLAKEFLMKHFIKD